MTAPNGLFERFQGDLCSLETILSVPGSCPVNRSAASAAAVWVFAFGVWMFLLGCSFVLLTFVGESPWLTKIHRLAARLGFPAKNAVWSRLFGGAIAAFSLFYFAAALFEQNRFFWMSIFGRVGIFGTCVVLSWRHRVSREGESPRPHALLLFAVPDFASALVTAFVLLPSVLASVVFVGGIVLLVLALGLFTFPEWIVQVIGLKLKPDTWNVILGVFLAFFGAYGVAAALLDLIPILWAAVGANVFLLVWLFLNVVLEPSRKTTAPPAPSSPPAIEAACEDPLSGPVG